MTCAQRLGLVAATCLLAAGPHAAWAQTSPDPIAGARPRLAIALEGVPNDFAQRLRERLDGTRRFEVNLPVNLGPRLRAEGLASGQALTPPQARRAGAIAGADFVLLAQGRASNGLLRVGARLLDLRTGEASRELATFGQSQDAATLATHLARHVRRSVPIRALVQDLTEEGVVLDRGGDDGVLADSSFRAFRHPQNLAPVPVGRVRITSLEPFTSRAEVEESAKGGLMAGDLLVEVTAGESMFGD